MAQTLVTNCAHCGAEQVAFTVCSTYTHKIARNTYSILGACNACDDPILVKVAHISDGRSRLESLAGDLLQHEEILVGKMWPGLAAPQVPQNVPPKVASNYKEAAEAEKRRSWNAACGMYRRTLEIALKEFSPEIEAWKLEKRINKLAEEHRITPDLQAWAHELRLDGNDALHGDADATEEMTKQMGRLCYFLLIYLFSLPSQVASGRTRRSSGV